MKKSFLLSFAVTGLLLAAMCLFSGCQGKKSATISNPLPMKMGDPFLLHSSNGHYYMYGTSLDDGFEAFVTDDFVEWKPCGQIYRGGTDGQWNKDCFWAPEVYERNGKYYLFYSANKKDNPDNELEIFRIGVAVADVPEGPFTDLYNRPVFEAPFPVIDANVFFDDANGKCYLYFSRCCYKHAVESELSEQCKLQGGFEEIEESWVYGAELKSDFSGIVGEPIKLLAPPFALDDVQSEWESRSVTSGEVNRRWTEGSYMVEHNGVYYMIYSANYYMGDYYAMGYASSDHPLGPFVKAANNPIVQESLSKGGKVMGTGHGMIATMPDGQRYIVYHGRTTDNPEKRVVLMDKLFIDENGVMFVNGPTTDPMTINF